VTAVSALSLNSPSTPILKNSVYSANGVAVVGGVRAALEVRRQETVLVAEGVWPDE
jgi:hypothetical protein